MIIIDRKNDRLFDKDKLISCTRLKVLLNFLLSKMTSLIPPNKTEKLEKLFIDFSKSVLTIHQ